MRRFPIMIILLVGCDLIFPPDPGPEFTDPLSPATLLAHVEFLAADSLYGRRAGSVYELQAAEYIRSAFVSNGLEPGAPDYFQTFIFPDSELTKSARGRGGQLSGVESRNVLGKFPGEGSLRGQWLILGAHYDHLGWRTADSSSGSADSIIIFNGANDNASGVALMMEVARYLAHYLTLGEGSGADRRSIMFQAYGAEELGLLGSIHFTRNPVVPMDSIAAMINLDMVGNLRDDELIVMGATSSPLWKALLGEVNSESLMLVYDDQFIGRSDQFPFYQEERPVLFFFTGMHDEYHTPLDDVVLLNLEGMVRVGNLAVAVLLNVTNRLDAPAYSGKPKILGRQVPL